MHVTIGEIIGNFILIAGSFLLLVFLVKKFAWGNIVGILDQRAQKISEDIDSAEAARKKAEDLAQKREDALAGSREEAAAIVETAKETAEKNKASILADTTEEVSRLKQKANQEIAQSKADALKSIKGDVADLSIDLASKIIGQTLDKEAQSQLIDSYIDKLGDA
ncbi:F0F1 ATP synthase subunit B [Streptococcus gordonii]|uniref:F0F1 ATP synthase subunit B n=1 Tax=Streptococcus gordonii TaxID=1302 RepID=UPI001CC1B75E|nr:F0F1 ATP synthase subunit B [Streptococcus gordonii]MBZ2133244.1 F0F1 ATP synthase subunit B [Streptococcus gordonii]MBZ2141781.1 F0F1 ATP synthase subunit B [Streptococcus gordonii]MBZ2143129.1 F0F1 ATP synthase subunit B [Streptococcus gordonii]MBZ2145424.1 F0F1 ATP synthase subunit B [Streptococcus gordonii]